MLATRWLATLVMVSMLALGGGGLALAQDDGPSPDSPTKDRDADESPDESPDEEASPEARPEDDEPLPEAPDGPLDLAAMTLTSNEIPAGFALSSESYIDLDLLGESFADILEPGEIDDLGIIGYYETTYLSSDGGSQIRSYAIEYPDVAAAEDGFALLEDEERLLPGESNLEDAPGPAGVGEEPSEITTGAYGSPGAERATVDITFRVDRLGVGVATETFDGSDPDQDVIEELAAVLEARVAGVLSGDEVDGVDPGLVELVVTLEGETSFEGYQTVVDGYGETATAADEGFVASYVRGATFSDDLSTTIAPYVTVSVSRYEDDQAVLAVLEQTDEFAPAYDQLDRIDVQDETSRPSVAYEFSSPIGSGDVDSARIFLAVDDILLSVDAQGFASIDDAVAAALAVAETATDCVEGGDCGPVGIPEPSGDDRRTPVASPEPDVL